MSAGFVFPPPPPPPPRAPQTTTSTSSFDPSFRQRGRGNFARYGQGRGRGRGQGPGQRPVTSTYNGQHRIGSGQLQHQRGGGRGNHGGLSSTTQHTRDSQESLATQSTQNHRPNLKRPWSATSAPHSQHVARGTAPPPVPSFGFELPVPTKPSPPSVLDISAPNKRKEKEKNKPGFFPYLKDHDSEEEDEHDDEDEESRLAAALHIPRTGDGIQIEHEGVLTSLSTPREIAAWIAERKRNYPTKAKIAEATARRQVEQQNRKPKNHIQGPRHGTQRDRRGSRTWEESTPRRGRHNPNRTEATTQLDAGAERPSISHVADADRMQSKVDELRGQLASLEQELARSKSKNATALSKSDSPNALPRQAFEKSKPSGSLPQPWEKLRSNLKIEPAGLKQIPSTNMPLTRTMLQQMAAEEAERDTDEDEAASVAEANVTEGTELEEEFDADETSSNGTSDTDSSEESEPEEQSSKMVAEAPIEIARVQNKPMERPCHFMLRRGGCRRGPLCNYSHDQPSKMQQRADKAPKASATAERMTVYERLMKTQNEQENEELLRYILAFGARGYLDPK